MSIVLVTGATAGIGKATALRFAKEGWNTIITGRRADRLEELAKEIEALGVKVLPLVFDVCDQSAVEAAVNNLPDEWSMIDVLVNNAGLAAGKDLIHEGSIEDWDRMIDTNIKGLLYVTRTVLPGMVERKSGHIINLSSIAGKEVYPMGNVYCATKHAVDALTKGMRIDLLDHNIRVTSVDPGRVETEFSIVRFKGDTETAKTEYEGYQPLDAADIADAIWWAASRPEHVNVNDVLVMPFAQGAGVHWKKK